ncbi:MAG: proline--tRNA ligase, partial [Deltaproteobacteria bacterium]|nr:proline--tRNA ligase [Deltaproteobacteria bacterium]
KYSETLGAKFLDEEGRERPCIMGCYGIGINRILAAAIETGNDENGCILPINIAPFEVEVLPLNNDIDAVVGEAARIYDQLREAGVEVLLDDRDVRPGVKFKDADLIGIPLRITVGEKNLKRGLVEIRRRKNGETILIGKDKATETVLTLISEEMDASSLA